MKKKRMVTALLTTAMVFGAVPTAFAADNITVTVDGQKVSFGDQQPVNINGRVMVPVRAVAEKMGWMRVIRWFGCLGMAASSLAFYYMPQYFGHNYWMAMIPAIALGTFVAAFVPMAAVFPALEPKHKGAAISVYNLSAGMSNFLAPAIAVVLLPWFSTIGVVIAYTALYLLAFVLCAFIRVEQPGFSSAPVTEKALNIS